MSVPITQFLPPSLSPLVSIYLLSMSVSLFLLCKYDHLYHFSGFPGDSDGKEYACNAGDVSLIPGSVGLIPGSGRSPGVGNGNPL